MQILLVSDRVTDQAAVAAELEPAYPALELLAIRDRSQLDLALARGAPDLALVRAPGTWAAALAGVQAVKARCPGLPVILLTAAADADQMAEGLAAGLDDYVLDGDAPRLPLAVTRALARGPAPAQAPPDGPGFLQRVLQTSPDVLYIYEVATGRNLYCNREILTVLGYTPEQIGATGDELLARLVHPADVPRVLDHHRRLAAAADGEVLDYEYRMRHAGGTWRWLSSRDTPFRRGPDGRLLEALGAAVDISERRQAEAALAHEHELLRALLDITPDLIFFKDAAARFTLVNHAHAQLLGTQDPAEVIGKSDFDFFPPADAQRFFDEDQEVVRTRRPIVGRIGPASPCDGAVAWLSWTKVPLLDDRGEAIGLVGIARDVTELQQAQAQRETAFATLRRRAEQLAALDDTVLAIAGTHALPDLLEAIVERAASLLAASSGSLYVCDPAARQARCVVSYHTGRDYRGTVLAYGVGAAGQIAETGRPLIIDDYRAWPGRAPVFEAEQPFAAVAATPMFWQGQVLGVLQVSHDGATRRFAPEDLELLGLFASHAALAVANARLLEGERSARSQAEALRHTAEALAGSLTRAAALDCILAEAHRLMPHNIGVIMLIEGPLARVAASRGFANPTLAGQVTLPVAEAAGLRTMWATGRPIAVPDSERDPHWIYDPISGPVRSTACAPIRIKGQIIGFLMLESWTPDFFSQPDAERLQPFADQAGVAIERAELYDAIRKHAAELEQRVEERTAEVSQRSRELAETAARLAAANEELRRASRLKDEFLANMSHELRTPLNSILVVTQCLAEGIYGPLNPKQAGSLQSVEESGRHLLNLINDVLDLSKITAGKLDLNLAPVELDEVCAAGVRLVQAAAKAKDLPLAYQPPAEAVILQADARRLRQILVNLLANAVKFTPAGGTVGLDVQPDAVHHEVHLTVWDTGIGIAEADLPRLFQPFVQLDAGRARRYEGTGLGLALVARLAELHGGRVGVTSAPGQGSRFTVTLPWA